MNKENQKILHDAFTKAISGDYNQSITFVTEERPSKDYGYQVALIFQNKKLYLTNGCGYNKLNEILMEVLFACFGRYIAIGGANLTSAIKDDDRLFLAGYQLNQVWSNRKATGWIFGKAGNL